MSGFDEAAGVSERIESAAREALKRKISCDIALSIRRAAIGAGVTQIGDFISGAAFGGLLVQKNLAGSGSDVDQPKTFRDVFEQTFDACAEDLVTNDPGGAVATLSRHRLSDVSSTPEDGTIIVGMMFEGAMSEAAAKFDMSKNEAMEVMAFITCLGAAAAAEKHNPGVSLESIRASVVEKADAWDMLFPSDEEAFGEEIAADLQAYIRS